MFFWPRLLCRRRVWRTLSRRARVRKRFSVFRCRLGSGARASNGPSSSTDHTQTKHMFRKLGYHLDLFFLFFALSLLINCVSYPL